MATLKDLVTAVAGITGLAEATVFAYGRFARQAGFISQKGRGHSAASMSMADAANLLMAVAGTGVTREAGKVISIFRSMKGGRVYDFSGGHSVVALLKFLSPMGVRGTGPNEDFKIKAEFGDVLEFLIQSTINGDLAGVFSRIPVAEIPHELWLRWRKERSVHLHESVDLLVKAGHIEPKPPAELRFGEDVSLEINFSRLVPAIEIEFLRMWDNPQAAIVLQFGPERGAQARAPHDMRLIATLTQHTLAAVGLVQCDRVRPAALRSYKPIDALFAQQFQSIASNAPGMNAHAEIA